MKFKNFSLAIALLVSALIAYTVYYYSLDAKKTLSTIFAFVSFSSYIGGLIGIKADYEKAQTLKNTVSVIFIFINLIITFMFLHENYSEPIYLLVNGLVLLSFYGLVNFFTKAQY